MTVQGTGYAGPLQLALRPPLPSGELKSEKVWATVAALMPADATIADESVTASFGAGKWMAGAPPHDGSNWPTAWVLKPRGRPQPRHWLINWRLPLAAQGLIIEVVL